MVVVALVCGVLFGVVLLVLLVLLALAALALLVALAWLAVALVIDGVDVDADALENAPLARGQRGRGSPGSSSSVRDVPRRLAPASGPPGGSGAGRRSRGSDRRCQ